MNAPTSTAPNPLRLPLAFATLVTLLAASAWFTRTPGVSRLATSVADAAHTPAPPLYPTHAMRNDDAAVAKTEPSERPPADGGRTSAAGVTTHEPEGSAAARNEMDALYPDPDEEHSPPSYPICRQTRALRGSPSMYLAAPLIELKQVATCPLPELGGGLPFTNYLLVKTAEGWFALSLWRRDSDPDGYQSSEEYARYLLTLHPQYRSEFTRWRDIRFYGVTVVGGKLKLRYEIERHDGSQQETVDATTVCAFEPGEMWCPPESGDASQPCERDPGSMSCQHFTQMRPKGQTRPSSDPVHIDASGQLHVDSH